MKKNRIIVICLSALCVTLNINAQFIKNTKKSSSTGWQNQAPQGETYGAAIDKAHEFLKGKKSKKTVTVAIIGPGIDVEHEDLQGALWKNPKEKEDDGIDNDGNGKTDDIYGWDYFGSKDGEAVEKALSFANREFFRLQDKYARILPPSKDKLFQVSADGEKLEEVPQPANKDEYSYYHKVIVPQSPFASNFGGIQLAKATRVYSKLFNKELKEKYPDREIYNKEFLTIVDPNGTDTLLNTALAMSNLTFSFILLGERDSIKWSDVYQYIQDIHIPYIEKNYKKRLEGLNTNDRSLVGDNPYDIKDTEYGNNVLMTENAGLGTLYAGIIGAKSGNSLGIDGIADNVRIMTLRTDPNEGDPYPKDVALAIRYAVDNGADIIQLFSPDIMYPYGQLDIVNDALRYAEANDVLIVQPASDEAYNMDDSPFYPNRNIGDGKALDDWITVAASNEAGNPMLKTNFGKKSLDLFAPGEDIYSTYTGDTYRSESGSDMAASMVTGVAALIRSYYPDLSSKQIREAIISSVTDRSGAEVEKTIEERQPNKSFKLIKDLFLFDDFSASNGILNAYEAVAKASKMLPEK